MADTEQKDSGIRVIPPYVFLAALILAFLADWLWPARTGLPGALRWTLGVALIVVPIAFMPSIVAAIRRTGSDYDVRKVPKALVTAGPFAWSRNPGYVALVLICVGIAVAFDNPWVFLFLIPAIAIVQAKVVLPEERMLEVEFGEQYLGYKRRVRRWI